MEYVYDSIGEENDFKSLEIFFNEFRGEGYFRTRVRKIYELPKHGSIFFGKDDDGFYRVVLKFDVPGLPLKERIEENKFPLMHIFHILVHRQI